MGAAGASYAREQLTWDRIARAFEELYRDDIASEQCRPAAASI